MRMRSFWIFFASALLFSLCFPHFSTAQDYSNWNEETPLPYPSSGNQLLLINNKIYNFGGGDSGTYHTEILSSEIDIDGHLSNWTNKGTLPTISTWYSITENAGHIYMLGGAIPSPAIPVVSSSNKVFIADIDLNGSIVDWRETTNLPQPLARGGVFIRNNQIYYIGGLIHNPGGNETVVNTVYRAQILEDGSIGSWVLDSNLPEAKAEFALATISNNVYVLGGMNANSATTNSSYRGQISNSSSEIVWNTESELPIGLRRPAFAVSNNNIYLIGGYNGSQFTRDTYVGSYSNSTNQIQDWTNITSILPHGECCSPAISNNKYIYLAGGHDGSNYYSNTYRLALPASSTFPDLKQYDPLWAETVYDTATQWSPLKTGINRWGCALTSAAMILSYYGHNVTPSALNTWLLANDGYIGDGFVDWSAITKYAKLSHDINPKNPKLEFKRYSKFDTNVLNAELSATRPAIVKINRNTDNSSHFVVLNKKEGQEFKMSDPASSESNFSFYTNFTPKRIETFVPSNTDLSYLYLYIDPKFELSVLDNAGVKINEYSAEEDPYIDQVSKDKGTQNKLKVLALPKPSQTPYTVQIKGNGSYSLQSRIYDSDANIFKNTFSKYIRTGQVDTFLVNTTASQKIKQVTYDFVRSEITDAYNRGDILKSSEYKALIYILDTSEKEYKKGKTIISKLVLDGMILEIKYTPKLIRADFGKLLISYIGYLKNSL